MLLLYSYLLLEKRKACPDKENRKSAHVKCKYKIKRTKNAKNALMIVTFLHKSNAANQQTSGGAG